MKLNTKALMLACAVLWGAVFLLVGVVNMIQPTYATSFLAIMASIYPGYDATGSIGSLIVGTLYALLDGAIGGLLLGWLYNRFAE